MTLELSEREHALMLLSMSASTVPKYLLDDFIVLYRRIVNLYVEPVNVVLPPQIEAQSEKAQTT